MPDIKNCVAVDWRQGKDRCYFFFKDTNTFSRFNNGDNEVPGGYPKAIDFAMWDQFHSYAKFLRFGFTVTYGGKDILYLFYLDGNIPKVCHYHQQLDKAVTFETLAHSYWDFLGPYFEKIVAGVWWREPTTFKRHSIYLFLMNDGHYLRWDAVHNKLDRRPIDNSTWPGVAPYKNEIVTAVQFDRDLARDVYYIFLTGNRYLKYDMDNDEFISGPHPVNDSTWPGLLRN